MKFRIALLASAAALGLGASSAQAQSLTGEGFFNYENSRGDINHFRFGGAGNYAFDTSGLNIGLSVDDNHLEAGGGSADLVTIAGNAFWRSTAGAFGGTFGHHAISAGAFGFGASADVQSYGAFGEWYAADNITINLKGGGFSGDADGGFFGAGGNFYFTPDLSLGANYNWMKFNGAGTDFWSISTGPEFQPFAGTPVVLGVNYIYSEVAGASSNGIGFSLKIRLGGHGTSLVSGDRTGPTQTNGALNLKF